MEINEAEIPALVNKIKNGLSDYIGARVYITENKKHTSFVIEDT